MGSDMTHRRLATGDMPAVEVRRSAWLIEVGPIRLARYRATGRVMRPVATPPRLGPIRATAAVAVGLLAVGAPIYLTQASVVGDGGYVVSQQIPDRPKSVAARPVTRVHHRRPAVAAPPVASTAEEGATLDGDQALAAAWRTGEPQQWASHGAFGIIVPGAIEREDGMVCRSLSRLTRHAGAPDTVARSRQCAVDSADPAEPTP